MLELLTVGIVLFDPFGDLGIDCCFDYRRDFAHLGSKLSDILRKSEPGTRRIDNAAKRLNLVILNEIVTEIKKKK